MKGAIVNGHIGWSELYGPERKRRLREYRKERLKTILFLFLMIVGMPFLMFAFMCMVAAFTPGGGHGF